MRTWQKGVALAAAWLGLGVPAWAQYSGYTPQPVGAARMIEPLPCGHSEPPTGLIPGPPPPPPVPPGCNSLPASHSSAFQCDQFPCECRPYATIGAIALQREGLGGFPIAHRNLIPLDTGIDLPAPLPPSSVLARLDDFSPAMSWGVKGTIGYLFGSEAIEVTGFYVPGESQARDIQDPGRISLRFRNPPLGFEGNNGLWLQADRLRTSLRTTLWNAEFNYRRWDIAVNGVELILGVRYLNLSDRLTIFTDDDGLTRPDRFGRPDPVRQATYQVNPQNQILAPQVGLEYSFPVPCVECLWLGLTAKTALGVTWVDRNWTLVRGDGFPGFNVHKFTTTFGQIYDLGPYFELHLLDRLRLRGAYNLMWIGGVVNPQTQINFDLAAQPATPRVNSTTFFHGPSIELQLLF